MIFKGPFQPKPFYDKELYKLPRDCNVIGLAILVSINKVQRRYNSKVQWLLVKTQIFICLFYHSPL